MINTDKEPDFINEKGVKWWLDHTITKYAQTEDIHGIKLEVVCWIIEMPDGYKTRVLVNKYNKVIEEDQTLEGIGSKIDIRKLSKRLDKE